MNFSKIKDLNNTVSRFVLGTMAILVISQSPLAASDHFKKQHEAAKQEKQVKTQTQVEDSSSVIIYDKLIPSNFVDNGDVIKIKDSTKTSEAIYISDIKFSSEKDKMIKNHQDNKMNSERKVTSGNNAFYQTKCIVTVNENGKSEKVNVIIFTDAKKGPPVGLSLTHTKPMMNSIAVQEKDIQTSINKEINPEGKPGFFETLGGNIDSLKDSAAASISSFMPEMN